ncbi:MAG: ribosome-associated protein [Methylobacteriaceae bacterium]|jgi:ribosome-associated protein|nr:ribosome-associated protein [Methylobacteriaceae bacterium]
MLVITDDIAIDDDELHESFVRASGPGGQNLNKLSSAVQLRFDLLRSPSLSTGIKQRAARVAGRRLNRDGVVVVVGQRFRSQARNRADVRARLVALLRKAAEPPPVRRPTRVPRAAKRQRLADKKKRSERKAVRATPAADSD